MKARWNTLEDRMILGAGTGYPNGGQKFVVEIPLSHPDMHEYDYGIDPKDPAHQPPPAAKVAPSKAVAGKQVKV